MSFDHVSGPASALVGGDASSATAADLLERLLQLAAVLALAETVGAMAELFARALRHSKERVAFGRPIGSFQAIKHLLADNSVELETSKAVLEAATRAVQDRIAAGEIVSIAKSYVGTAGVDLAHACWQMLGGIAYQWDHDFHLYLRRITVDAVLYGDPSWHNERICALHGL